jgi:uncharacterized membrane protein
MSQPKSATNALIVLVGIIVLIAGGAYGLYLKFGPSHLRYSQAAVDPVVLALVIVGLVVIILGAVMMSRKKVPKTPMKPEEEKKGEGKPGTTGPT